jgi:hypothetical protein
MGIGDAPLPVDSDTEINNPVPQVTVDKARKLDNRLTVLERSGNSELVRQIRWLYENLPGGPYPYPPP